MKGVLIDLDGVVYQDDKLIVGSEKAVRWLKDNDIPHIFLTNTSSNPRSFIQLKLKSIRIEAELNQILTPAVAACQWIKNNKSMSNALFVSPELLEDFQDIIHVPIEDIAKAQSVVIGDLGENWNFYTMNKAFQILMSEPKPRLIALGMTRYWRAQDGLRLDVAPFVKALEHASGCEVIVTGKPSKTFFQLAIEQIGIDAEQLIMIGDDINVDVLGAQQSRIKGCLVKTGKFREADLQQNLTPDWVLSSLAELPQRWGEMTAH